MGSKKRIGVIPDLYTRPLVATLGSRGDFETITDVPARLALQLRDRDLDAAFLTPIDYAKESSSYRIVPGTGVSSSQASGTICLFFRDNLATISTVAIDPSSTSEIVLARIVLAEEFDLEPTFAPFTGDLDDGLERADAVLLYGDASVRALDRHPNRIDLVESWEDISGLPYMHGIWCAHDEGLTPAEVQSIHTASREGIAALDSLAGDHPHPAFLPSFSLPIFPDYYSLFSYDMTDEDLDGLREFLRYAFYHGVLPDIADLNFFRPLAPNPSHN
jgi:chorismate dehydratase